MKLLITGYLSACFTVMTYVSSASVSSDLLVETAGWQVVIKQPKITIGIPDVDLTFRVGSRLPFIQKNEKYYVAMVPSADNTSLNQLCAFPRWDRQHQPTAWVSDDHELVFAQSVDTCKGQLFLGEEKLPLLSESETVYNVSVERHGHSAMLSIPKVIDGVVVQKNADFEETAHAGTQKTGATRKSFVINNETIKSFLALAPKDDGSKSSSSTIYMSYPASTRTMLQFTGFNPFASQMTLSIMSGALFFLSFVFWLRDKRRQRPGKARSLPFPVMPAIAPAAVSETQPRVISIRTAVQSSGSDGDLSGSIQSMAIAEIIQFLNSSKETGRLLVKDRVHLTPSLLLLQDGEIIDAKFGKTGGEEAARSIIALKQGSFTFKRETKLAESRTISQSTMSMVLDVIKTLDEDRVTA